MKSQHYLAMAVIAIVVVVGYEKVAKKAMK